VLTWVDLVDPDEDAIERAVQRTPHPRALNQLLRAKQHADEPRPTLEPHDDYVFGVFLVPRLDLEDGSIGFREIDLVLASDLVVTVRKTCDRHGVFHCHEIRERHAGGHLAETGMVAYRLLDSIAEAFLELTDRLHDRIDLLEDNVDAWPGAELRRELATLRRELLHIRHVLAPTRDAVRRVIDGRVDVHEGEAIFSRPVELHFLDLHEKLLRASEALDLARDLIAGVRDYLQARVAEEQNETMRRLTVVASLALVPTIVVGFYGMNIARLPTLGSRHAYLFVIGLITVIAVAQLLFFRRRRWI
jgi:magnesium transporter